MNFTFQINQISSYIGIKGNKQADKAAQKSLIDKKNFHSIKLAKPN